MSRVIVRSTPGFAFATLLAFAGGCSSNSGATYSASPGGSETTAAAQPAAISVPGVQRTATAVEGLNATAQELGNTRQTIGETLAAAQELSSTQGDLLGPFQRFIGGRAKVDQADQQLAQRGEDMRARARDYITNWEVEVYGVEDPNLRTQADSRRSKVRADYGRIADATRSLRESMQPFRQQLGDLQTFLANDLTAAGVKAAAPSIQRATQSGQTVQQRIDALVAELNRVAGAMTPAVTPGNPAVPGSPASLDANK
jgi:hypothetical protein